MDTMCVDIYITDDNIIGGARALLRYIRPEWKYTTSITVTFSPSGKTNKLIRCYYRGNMNDVVMIRIYGKNTDLLIDRDAEIKNFELLQTAGYAPQLYSIFRNGLAYEYIPGIYTDVCSVRHPTTYRLIATMLAKIHKVECQLENPVLWEKLYNYLSLIPETYSHSVNQLSFTKTFPKRIQTLYSEVQMLEKELGNLASRVVFCHNDLLPANIIRNDGKVTFIDYQYAACNYQAYDIGNHFAEFAGVSNVDHSLYPGPDFQHKWLKIYIEEFNSCENSGKEVSEKEVENLYIQVNKFALVSHLFWTAWALVQAEHSTIDFDFIGYAGRRMKEYMSKRKLFLSM